jgi:TonB-linked SusC/RagA family outer membrane protein
MRRCAATLLALAATAAFLFPATLGAQQGTVTGTVLSARTGEPLDGVTLTLERVGQEETRLTGYSAATGRFLIVGVPAGQYVARAELLGFAAWTQVVQVAAGQPAVLDFRLEPEPISLSEIVVTGVIGATQRTKLPFEVAQVRAADLPVPSLNAVQSLQGKVAGALVVPTTGTPGAPASILLRGVTSLNAVGRGQEPLYIVDDVIVGTDLVDLGSLDIQSIEVVKGAAAASLYGSRAGNGIVHVRTRRGAQMATDQVRFTLRSEMGGSTLGRRPRDMFSQAHPYAMTPDGQRFLDLDGNPCEWLDCRTIALAGQTAHGAAADQWNTVQSNPWPGKKYDQLERFFNHGTFLQNYLTAEGRSGSSNFLVSASQVGQEGIVRSLRGFTRTNFRINLDHAFGEELTLRSSVFYSRSKRPSPFNVQAGISNLLRVAPIVDLLAPDPEEPGEVIYYVAPSAVADGSGRLVNPIYDARSTTWLLHQDRFLGSVAARYAPLEWLALEGNFSFDRADENERWVIPKGARTLGKESATGELYRKRNLTEATNASLTASARWTIADGVRNHTQARYLAERWDYDSGWLDAYDFAVEGVPVLANTDPSTLTAGQALESTRADGYYLDTNFDLYDRYVVDALVRNDGSSLFGEQERRQWYFRLGAAWRLSQEDFFRVPAIDELKLRYSVGTAGGRPWFYAQYETWSVEGGVVTLPSQAGNPRLKPERSTEHEAGLDLSAFDFRAVLSLTHARTTTENQILPVPQASYTGYQTVWGNAGTLASRTWEATLDVRLVERPALTWSARVLFDATRTEITALDRPAFRYQSSNQMWARVGEEIGTYYGAAAATSCANLPTGLSCDEFAVNDQGLLVWVGAGGSLDEPRWGTPGPVIAGKRVNWGSPFRGYCADRVSGEPTLACPLGKMVPDCNLGLSTTVSWRGLTAYALLGRSAGFVAQRSGFANQGEQDQDRVPEAQRKPLGYFADWFSLGIPSSANVKDGTFTKLREASLSYRLGPALLRRIPGLREVASVGIQLAGQNLFTWSRYPGFDSDTGYADGASESPALYRFESLLHPSMRNFTAAVEVVF